MRRIVTPSGDYIRIEDGRVSASLLIWSDSEHAAWESVGMAACAPRELRLGLDLAAAEEMHRQLGEWIRRQRSGPAAEPGREGVETRRLDLEVRARTWREPRQIEPTPQFMRGVVEDFERRLGLPAPAEKVLG